MKKAVLYILIIAILLPTMSLADRSYDFFGENYEFRVPDDVLFASCSEALAVSAAVRYVNGSDPHCIALSNDLTALAIDNDLGAVGFGEITYGLGKYSVVVGTFEDSLAAALVDVSEEILGKDIGSYISSVSKGMGTPKENVWISDCGLLCACTNLSDGVRVMTVISGGHGVAFALCNATVDNGDVPVDVAKKLSTYFTKK